MTESIDISDSSGLKIWVNDMLSKTDIDELLEQREGRSLDFKAAQYPFDGADDIAKGELLKDILAFANTLRMHDAYILIGVREVKDGKSIVLGVADHLDDAHLQQFINSKINRKIAFSYEATKYDDMTIGVLHIDRDQRRPIWSLKDFGKVIKDAVYIRTGSSTAVANNDDIAKIGADQSGTTTRRPDLSFSFYLLDSEEHAKSIRWERTHLRMPPREEIKDYRLDIVGPGGMRLGADHVENHDFYREVAIYVSQRQLIVPVQFCVENLGSGTANDLAITLRFVSTVPEALTLLEEDDLEAEPHWNSLMPTGRSFSTRSGACVRNRNSNGWSATFTAQKVLAKELRTFPDTIYIHSTCSATISIDVSILAEEFSGPVKDRLSIEVEVKDKAVTADQLYRLARD